VHDFLESEHLESNAKLPNSVGSLMWEPSGDSAEVLYSFGRDAAVNVFQVEAFPGAHRFCDVEYDDPGDKNTHE